MESKPGEARRSRRPKGTPKTAARPRTRTDAAHSPFPSDPPDQVDNRDGQRIGPYELRYDVRRGYGVERKVVRP